MATAELAVAMPVVAGLLVLGIGVVGLGVDQIRCVDAARIGARALARGDPSGQVEAAVRAAAPMEASVVLSGDAQMVSATVRLTRRLPGGVGGLSAEATSRADRELADPSGMRR